VQNNQLAAEIESINGEDSLQVFGRKSEINIKALRRGKKKKKKKKAL